MSVIRKNLIDAAIDRAYALIDYNIHNNIHKKNEFQKQVILADESLTKDEKSEAIRELNKIYDQDKIIYNEGTRRVCENCNQKCLATLYCEFCVRNYLKAKFSNWTSGNDEIDNLIQECQMKAIEPANIVEWIPYSNLENINYLTKGGYSEIYTAKWINGSYDEWDSKEQQLIRLEEQDVVLKRLENVESANKRWFEEATSHLNISNKWSDSIVQCYGLTQDLLNGDYMLVMDKFDTDLRKYLQQNHNQFTWKERIQIAVNIIDALYKIHHYENAIHRDLHSGNILFRSKFNISDLGFCGPADKPLKSIYGNLPYIAPEVIAGKETTFESDIYSIAMLMWEISSGQPPFINYEHDYYLAMNIIKGIRPKIVPGTPIEYKNLMIQCWDANPLKRPDINTLSENYTSSSKLFTSKVHQFENLPEPRNATEEEQQAFHSNKSYDFHIPNHIDDIGKLSTQNNNYSKITSSNKSFKRRLENDFQEIIQQVKRYRINIDDEEEIYNNPNFHSEEQDEFELPENMDEN
ncbi:kinase-like domain-containing protein [Rhizophagus irregularis DAOM 181602=DAOM 197198]|uniref:Kinase-like domain-containing protein n=1 Tax=Rhizophagus irregularis (strain DAOM 181602 / DAOM 197198 / MUCL 43194) TaxID=747089 RepID=A0A2P4QNF7_RHIID|nr:kinase-like domain-containing protein [Rhizophagus irregularis DAOM 181602=DAOM 197198]POG79165.1 kinase-like domain-containing protein [Rhizophagus irregularis DAOM 181602=DAOM 197198]|eukprot:XP_025186031.1 kinase-like domain-containing protein [Rhizophagus irregularis DAOM 181602=DAOM 197198]